MNSTAFKKNMNKNGKKKCTNYYEEFVCPTSNPPKGATYNSSPPSTEYAFYLPVRRNIVYRKSSTTAYNINTFPSFPHTIYTFSFPPSLPPSYLC